MAGSQAMKRWTGFGPREMWLMDRYIEQMPSIHAKYLMALIRALHDGTTFDWNGTQDPVHEIARRIGERRSWCMSVLDGSIEVPNRQLQHEGHGVRPPPIAIPKYNT